MNRTVTIPELLAPAGNPEKLAVALRYGADAVYLGGSSFGLRAHAGNFTLEGLRDAVKLVHRQGKRIYLTLNAFLHNADLAPFADHLRALEGIPFDAFIVSDPAAILLCREIRPEIPIHLSTQANTTNHLAAEFWRRQGVTRINLARESTIQEIRETCRATPLEIEVFVHGAMCVSYSGRCLLSALLTGRDANRGECTHPCRWKYALVEETRPGEFFPIEENDQGSFIFNSKDLCLIDHLPLLIESGVSSLKIEGRMKGIHYLATVVRVYREALDRYAADPSRFETNPSWRGELSTISHRGYTTGFLFGPPATEDQEYDSRYRRNYRIVGVVTAVDRQNVATVGVRNRFSTTDQIEIYTPRGSTPPFRLSDTLPCRVFNPNETVPLPLPFPVEPFDILRQPGWSDGD